MRIRAVITLIVLLLFTSCIAAPRESTVAANTDVVQSVGERVLLDYAFSPTGDRLAVFDNTGVYIYDLNSMQKSSFLEFDDSNFTRIRSGAVAFSPDGQQIALSGKFDEAIVTVWDLKAKKAVSTIQDLPSKHYITEIEFSLNRNSILVRNTNLKANKCQGFITDRIILHNFKSNKNVFEMENCVIYPPLRFSFTNDDMLFLYSGSMSNAYSIYFIDSNTGHVVTKEDLEWAKHGNFYSVSPDGTMRFVEKVENEKRTTYILDSRSREVLTSIEGKIALMYHLNDFVINPSMPNSDWRFWEDGKFKCIYGGIQLSPEFKASANREVLMVMNSYTKYQIWKVPTCEMVGELQFDK